MSPEESGNSFLTPDMKAVMEQDSAKIEAIEAAKSEIALRCKAKLKTRPDLVYQILTDPNSIMIFRNMKARDELSLVAMQQH